MIANVIKKIKDFFTEPKIPLAIFAIFLIVWAGITLYALRRAQNNLQIVSGARYQIGREASGGIVSLTVESVRRDSVGAGPLTPPPGYEFVIAKIVLKNLSSLPFDFIPFLFLHVRDLGGNVYTVDAIPSDSNQYSGPLLGGDILREEVGFKVPKNAKGLTLFFEPGTAANQRVIAIDLENHDSGWPSWWPWK